MNLFRIAIMFAILVAFVVAAEPKPTLELTSHTFYDYITENAAKRVMVKFYASWCGHCKALAPVWDQLQEDNEDLAFVNVNCETNKDICLDYGVRGYPTIKLFHDLKYTEFEGPRDEDFLVAFARTTETTTAVEIPLPPLVRELIHDLKEIWAIRRNALGVITLVTFLFGAIFSCLFCTRTKIIKAKAD